MLVMVDSQVLTDLYELKKQARILSRYVQDVMCDVPYRVDGLENAVNIVDKLTGEGTERDT